jgi:hypothetical protein
VPNIKNRAAEAAPLDQKCRDNVGIFVRFVAKQTFLQQKIKAWSFDIQGRIFISHISLPP